MLSNEQQGEFARVGVVRLTGVFSEAAARRMCDRVWDRLTAKHGIAPDQPATWTIRQPTGFQALTRSRAFDALAGRSLTDALDQLLGKQMWGTPKQWGTPLVTFPGHSSEWEVPNVQWHLDFPARGPSRPLPGVRVLAFLASVAPRGGGTLVLTGSHILVERLVAAGSAGRGHSTEVRSALAQKDPWLRDLWSKGGSANRIQRYLVEGRATDGATMRVMELTGAPGDVILMHPWMFHAPAPNCGSTPRMMVSHSVFRQSCDISAIREEVRQ